MNLETLRGLCRQACGNVDLSVYMPDEYGVIRQALRGFANYIEGIPRRATITTENGTREYGTNDGFPTDFLSVEAVYNNSNNTYLEKITFDQRLETSTGTPAGYYKRGLVIGFDKECDGVYTIYFYYRGTGDDVTDDDDDVLPEFAFHDDDFVWKAITHYFAMIFWEEKLAEAELRMDANGILVANNARLRHEYLMLQARHETAQRLDKWNKDQPVQVSLPEYFFASSNYIGLDHNRVIRRR